MDHGLKDPRLSTRASLFPESVIREMTRHAMKHEAVNLAQGFPDWNPPAEVVAAAKAALDGPHNQYAITWGAPALRQAIAEKMRWFNDVTVDPETEITVTCGATEAMMAIMLAIVDPGDEVIVFEPFYENYGPDAALSGATLRFVPLRPDRDFRFDPQELAAAFSPKTKAIIVNTPANPAGTVFTRAELELIGELCREHDALLVTDEIYEHILYDGKAHVAPIALPDLRDRVIMVSGASKTYSMTGWRVAWVIAPPAVSTAIRRTHDFLTVGAPHPLQMGVAAALKLPTSYYRELAESYDAKRRFLVATLQHAGFECHAPEGAYYVMADFRELRPRAEMDDRDFALWLVKDIGLAGVPGGSFFRRKELGRDLIRFHFAKSMPTLEAAAQRLNKLR
ncbi:MAG TPA: aminotransferase class I/II-fold pyridoxal phosphate-dependent enzyme [Candidatus Thermoplasmatota archaeon]|nr:aminotransferase class I/II-fold pyridoxal phosphate-dependent enzyme [Candidatus Thermoplasmatota archaeon]